MWNDDRSFEDFKKGTLYQRLDDLSHSFDYMVRELQQNVLPFTTMFVRYFTDHGAEHSLAVALMMDKLIAPIEDPPINKFEAFVLLASAWLHDIGMLNNIDPLTGLHLEDHEIRARHAELSEDIIKKYGEKLFDNAIFKHDRLISSIISVCKYHSADKGMWDSLLPIVDTDPNKNIRRTLMISILRLADLLDLRPNRAPRLTGEIVHLPGESVLHWEMSHVIPDYNLIQIENKLRIKINGSFSDTDNEKLKFKEFLFYHKIQQIEEEIETVKIFFDNAGVQIETSVDFTILINERLIENDREKLKKPIISETYSRYSTILFKHAKELLIDLEFSKLKKLSNSSYLLFDFCLNAAETIGDVSAEIKWRQNAQKLSKKIRTQMTLLPPTHFFLSRIKYNELYLEKLIANDFEYIQIIEDKIACKQDMSAINPVDIFLYGMHPNGIIKESAEEKINILKSLDYLGKNINQYTDEYNLGAKKIQLRYGLTSIHPEVQKTMINIIKNQIKPSRESNCKAVHNACGLCSGRVLSILSYWIGMELSREYFPENEIEDNINGILNWIKQQKYIHFSKLNSRNSHETPRASAAILEGLVDLYHFNHIESEIVKVEEIEALLNELECVLVQRFSYNFMEMHKRDFTASFSLIISEYLRALFYYQNSRGTPQKNILSKEALSGFIKEVEKLGNQPLAEQILGWESAIFLERLNNQENIGTKSLPRDILNTLIIKNYEWRHNGSWNNDVRMTEKIVNGWLSYWELFWRDKENRKKEEK